MRLVFVPEIVDVEVDVVDRDHECPACARCVVCETRRCREHRGEPPARLDFDGHDSVCESRAGWWQR